MTDLESGAIDLNVKKQARILERSSERSGHIGNRSLLGEHLSDRPNQPSE